MSGVNENVTRSSSASGQRDFWRWALCTLPFVMSAVILLIWTVIYGPSWPHQDSWFYLSYLREFQEGSLTLGEFLTIRNNEHFVAVQYGLAMWALSSFGLTFRWMIFANAALLLLFGWIIFVTVRRVYGSRLQTVAAACVISLAILNPSQASYLLWEFQNWFYYDLVLFAASTLLIERYRLRSYPWVLLMCILATGSEAQGAFLWLISGIHLCWSSLIDQERKNRLGGILILLLHSAIFLILAWLLTHTTTARAPASGPFHGDLIQVLRGFTFYFVTVLGGGFGTRDVSVSFGLGFCSIVAWALCSVIAIRERCRTIDLRVGFLLTSLGLLWHCAFTEARFYLGIPWALGDFHGSPMLIPFFVGLAVYGMYVVRTWKNVSSRAFATLALFLAVFPLVTGASTAASISRHILVKSRLSAGYECVRPFDQPSVGRRLAGLYDDQSHYMIIDHYRTALCAAQKDPSRWLSLVMPPPDLRRMMSDVESTEAIWALWSVYLTHDDLLEAFNREDPAVGTKLIEFAAADAKGGSLYDPSQLFPFARTYERMASSPNR